MSFADRCPNCLRDTAGPKFAYPLTALPDERYAEASLVDVVRGNWRCGRCAYRHKVQADLAAAGALVFVPEGRIA